MAQFLPGQGGSDDVFVQNATTVGDFQNILQSLMQRLDTLEGEVAMNASGSEQQLAAIRVDIRTINQQAAGQGASQASRFDLIDTKAMSPNIFSGDRSENFKQWVKKVKAYCNARLAGYRRALEATEKLTKDQVVDAALFTQWDWKDVVEADSKLHDLLLIVTGGEANGIVETVPGRGFEAWRLLNNRYNAVGELYTFDKMNAIMKQSPAKNISEIPAAIARFEKDLKIFRERTETEFPEVLKLPILMQMIPVNWKKEFDTRFRDPGYVKSYESLAGQLISIGNEERYMSSRHRGDDMDVDQLTPEQQKISDNLEARMKGFLMPSERQGEDAEPEYSDAEWRAYHAEKIAEASGATEQVDWLGKGKGKGKSGKSFGNQSKGGGWQASSGSGGKNTGGQSGASASEVVCLWCNEKGHVRRDCKQLAQYKKDKDAARAKLGDHSPFVPRRKSPSRGANSLDLDYGRGDYLEEVVGLTDDDEDCSSLDEEFTLGTLKNFEDYEAEDDDSDDGSDYLCEMTSEQPGQFGKGADVNYRAMNQHPGVESEEETIVTPPRSTSGSRTTIDRNTPMADILSAHSSPEMNLAKKAVVVARYKGKGSSFYNAKCNWEVLDVDNMSSDSGSDAEEITTITATAGSTVGSALRTDETAAARRVQDHHAEWHGALSKPVHGWPVRRRVRVVSRGTQTNIVMVNQEVQVISDELAFEASASVRVDQGEVMSCDLSGDEELEIIPSDEDDDGEEENVELTSGEVSNRKRQKLVPDENGFFDCNPDDVDLCRMEVRERSYGLRRGVIADSGAGDPVCLSEW